jgi:signal transduction histidine kinase
MKSPVQKYQNPLSRYIPPFHDWRFWVIQILAILIAVLHSYFEGTSVPIELQRFYFVPISLLVVPIVFAALIFGFAGSISTALWVVVLTIHNVIFGHEGVERIGEIFQLGILVTLSIIMGLIIDREHSARAKIESANAALSTSEKKYRDLCYCSPFPILLLNSDKIIIDANPAASELLGKAASSLRGTPANLIGIKNIEPPGLTSPHYWWESSPAIIQKQDSLIYLEPTFTNITDNEGNALTQIMLRDITQAYHKQEGLKAYTAYILRVQEEERQRIARELHDDTIQLLTQLCRQLDRADNSLRDTNLIPVAELEEARKIAEKVVVDLRDFTRTLRPPILDDLGAVASIRRLFVDFLDRTKMQGQLQISGKEQRLPQENELNLFRIAQEALWNVEHHAQAENILVKISFSDKNVTLEVHDDGQGFNVPAVISLTSASSRLGLVGMQERAELSGGEMKIESQPGKGTFLTVSIPIQPPKHETRDILPKRFEL